ncbi:glycogen(starch) synthase [Trueperella bonasi]|uniref:Glycogen(Starch) synthase n=1 Tax=Trueperella bonasi TaxID=312286 RepID=A0ABT9NF84_9ACTO|nr:glycosyltransferase [Trueperella bonasi]MDP9806009.1 glycogen(starch) synthase [Trueperella bonasi]
MSEHVVWTPSWYPSADNPLNGIFFAEQVEMLRDAGMDVGVLALDPHSFWQGKPEPVMRNGRVFRRGVPVLPKGIFPGDQALINIYAGPLADAYEQACGVPHLIHAHSVFPGILLAKALSDRWGVPYGITEHRPTSLERDRRSPRFRAIHRAVAGTSFRFSVSEGMAQCASAVYGRPFEIFPLPVPTAFTRISPEARAHSESSEFVFVHLSVLDRNKRPEETVRAFARVHAQRPATRLIIGGGSPDRVAEVASVARELGVAHAVTCTGRVERADVPAFMANADCHVLFSAQEAGGTVFSEAHAVGTPSIASATDGGSFNVLPEFGFVVPIDDVDALADAMLQMIAAKESGHFAREHIRAAALERVGPGAYASKTRVVYNAAVSR